ncbi:hypothetical protein B0H21DRAFT_890144 [Amylocystis lapponica]|nr:hypothetical protein B0H21DRAFT_890144 [Amylocystis lapponica]
MSICLQLLEPATYFTLDAPDREFHALVSADTATLREMSVWGTIMILTPAIRQNLTHLEVVCADENENFAQLLQETLRLESLIILYDCLFEVLKLNATTLPHLTSFKLLEIDGPGDNYYDDDENPVEVIANFLRDRHNLRRLDLGFRYYWRFKTLLPLFEGLQWRELESLDVLGIGLECEITMENALLLIEHCIPETSLRYLSPGMTVTRMSMSVLGFLTLTMQFSGFPNLNFLYIDDQSESEKLLDCDDVVKTFQRLELFGYSRNKVIEIERQGDGTILSTSKWSMRKIEFRDVEDFGCGDWEWLMRHHIMHGLV